MLVKKMMNLKDKKCRRCGNRQQTLGVGEQSIGAFAHYLLSL
jgi:hypothetical protein